MVIGLGLEYSVSKRVHLEFSESEACGYRSGVRVWYNGSIVLRGTITVGLEKYIDR